MWLSFHLYFGDDLYGGEVDRLLVSTVAPLVDELSAQGRIERWFFVRYGDPASHLRLRLEARPRDAGGVAESVESAFEGFRRREAEGVGADRPGRLERVPYVPEVDRYGGRHGLRLAERHFLLSSTVALGVVAETLGGRLPARVGKALLLAVLLAESVPGVGSAASFLDWYSESYLRHVWREDGERRALRRRLDARAAEDGEPVDRAVAALRSALARGGRLGTPILDDWSRGCGELCCGIRRGSELRVDLRSYLASLLHMHHNRLGLSIPQEVHLTNLAARSLARAGGPA